MTDPHPSPHAPDIALITARAAVLQAAVTLHLANAASRVSPVVGRKSDESMDEAIATALRAYSLIETRVAVGG